MSRFLDKNDINNGVSSSEITSDLNSRKRIKYSSDFSNNLLFAVSNGRKSEEAHILHAQIWLDNATHNEWQCRALAMGNQ